MKIPCPRLIEVALPVRETSAQSVRDKNIHHAHISYLHIWWAPRPLLGSRAVVFPWPPDPYDLRSPSKFRPVVKQKLKTHVPEAFKFYQPSSLGGESDREAFRKQDSNLPSPMEYLRITLAIAIRI